jgi:hypothetical protein
MLIQRLGSYALRRERRTGRREAQNRETGQLSKNLPCMYQFKPVIYFVQRNIPMGQGTVFVSFFFFFVFLCSELYTTHKHVRLTNTGK